MSNRTRTARAAVLAFAAGGVLGFGAPAALADVPPICPRLATGKCTSLEQCQNQCAQAGGDVSGARCGMDGGVGCCYFPVL